MGIYRAALGGILAWFVLAAVGLGCGTQCPEIRQRFEAFERGGFGGAARGDGPDVALGVPWPLVDALISEQVQSRAMASEVNVWGVSLPFSLKLVGFEAKPDAPGWLAGALILGLAGAEGEALAELEVGLRLRPKWQGVAGARAGLRWTLYGRELAGLKAALRPEGQRMLGGWMAAQLGLDDSSSEWHRLLGGVGEEILGLAMEELWPSLRDLLFEEDEAIFTFEMAMPHLPVRALEIRSVEEGLILEAESALARRGQLTLPAFVWGGDERLVAYVAPETAAEWINEGMRRGSLPSRFDGEGTPEQDGVWEARVGWGGGPRPLNLFLWRDGPECREVRVQAALDLAVREGRLVAEVSEGRAVQVKGSGWAEAFYWLDQLFSDALHFAHEIDAWVQLGDGEGALGGEVVEMALEAEALRFGFGVGP